MKFIFFEKKLFITNKLISFKLDSKHLGLKGLQVCSNKGPGLVQREIITLRGWINLKNFSRTTESEKCKFTQSYCM
jgi:hypothetical protein